MIRPLGSTTQLWPTALPRTEAAPQRVPAVFLPFLQAHRLRRTPGLFRRMAVATHRFCSKALGHSSRLIPTTSTRTLRRLIGNLDQRFSQFTHDHPVMVREVSRYVVTQDVFANKEVRFVEP